MRLLGRVRVRLAQAVHAIAREKPPAVPRFLVVESSEASGPTGDPAQLWADDPDGDRLAEPGMEFTLPTLWVESRRRVYGADLDRPPPASGK